MKLDKDMGSILGPELKIDGNVKVEGSLLIYGTVNGNIESHGSVRTAKGSAVKGDIIGKEAHICGLVEGNLMIDGKIICRRFRGFFLTSGCFQTFFQLR